MRTLPGSARQTMSFKAPNSAASAVAMQTAATPARLAAETLGQAGSRDSLAQLTAAMRELKVMATQPLLQRAVDRINAEDFAGAEKLVQKALERDELSGFGWYLLAITRERAGDFASSIKAYEAALALIPEHAEIANDLGRLAYRMGMKVHAEKLFRHFLARHPDHPEAINNLGCALRDQRRFDEAIELLRPAIQARPHDVQLWNNLGTVLAEQGDYPNAEMFFGEALRLDPKFGKSRYNLGNAKLALGDAQAALECVDAALKHVSQPAERLMMRLARSTILIALSRIGDGWDEYEARLDPQFADTTHFMFERPRWEPGMDLAGKSLLVCGEQGLGDEILFANVLPDVIEKLGPDGALTIVVEPRLVPLFQRSFPTARVAAHATYDVGGHTIRYAPDLQGQLDQFDAWTPIACLLREFRRTVEAFPNRVGFLRADPARVAHWRKVLDEQAPKGVKIGLLWKSAVDKDARHRFFSPFAGWSPVLKAPTNQDGACFVNLQYGDCSEELAMAEREFGVRIWTPPGIDLKQDLDDIAALCMAMDLVVGFSNATLNIAAACGAPTWLISVPGSWPRLGTNRYPWYPQVRTFTLAMFGAWAPIMETVGEALARHLADRETP